MMERDNNRPTPRKLNLVDKTVEGTEIHLDILINDTGGLVMEGQDLGDAPGLFFGDLDYEYWVTVRKEYKDWLLLNLMKRSLPENRNQAPTSWSGRRKRGFLSARPYLTVLVGLGQ